MYDLRLIKLFCFFNDILLRRFLYRYKQNNTIPNTPQVFKKIEVLSNNGINIQLFHTCSTVRVFECVRVLVVPMAVTVKLGRFILFILFMLCYINLNIYINTITYTHMAKKVTFNENLLVEEKNATSEKELEKIIARVTSLVIKELKNKNNIKSVLKKTSKESVINKATCTSTSPKKAASLTPKKKRKKMTPIQKKKALEKKKKAAATLLKKQKNRSPAEYTELLHIDEEQTYTT